MIFNENDTPKKCLIKFVVICVGVILLGIITTAIIEAATHTPWDGTKWDVTSPDIDQPIGNHYKELYDLRKGIALRMNKEHETLATSSAGGVHKQGSARAFFQDAQPTTQVDGSAFDSGDLGSLWFDSDSSIDNCFYVLTATTPTWTPVSTEIIATLLASNRTFAGTLGVDGTFTSTGIATLAKASLLASSDAPTTDAMIANKKYVDDAIAAAIPVHSAIVKAWAMISSNDVIHASYNVTSITGMDDGQFQINWDTDFADENYAVVFGTVGSDQNGYFYMSIKTQAAGYCIVQTCKSGEADKTHNPVDWSVAAFGAQ